MLKVMMSFSSLEMMIWYRSHHRYRFAQIRMGAGADRDNKSTGYFAPRNEFGTIQHSVLSPSSKTLKMSPAQCLLHIPYSTDLFISNGFKLIVKQIPHIIPPAAFFVLANLLVIITLIDASYVVYPFQHVP